MAFNKTSNNKYHHRGAQKPRPCRHPRSPRPDSPLSSENLSTSFYSFDNSNNVSRHCQRCHPNIPLPKPSQYVALDCEMVGTLTGKSVAARVVILNWKGKTIYDEYIAPTEQVTNYCTFVSGVTAENLKKYGKALWFIRMKIIAVLRGKVLVGHALHLGITHLRHLQRDTAHYEPFMQIRQREKIHSVIIPRKLRLLTPEQIGRQIQVTGKAHCPAEDAIANLDL